MVKFKELKEIVCGTFHEILQIEGGVWVAVLLGSIITISYTALLAWRYRVVLGFLGEKIRLFDSFNITCSNYFLDYLTPLKIGSVLTKPLITKVISSVSFKKAALAALFEQMYEITFQVVILPVLIYIIGAKYFPELWYLNLLIFVVLFTAMIIAAAHPEKVISALWKIRFLAPKFVRNFSKKRNLSKSRVLRLIERSKSYLSNKKLFGTLLCIALLNFVVSALSLKVFLVFFGYDKIPYYLILAGFWAPVIMGRLSGLPLGLGVRDVSLGAILVAFGVSLTDSLKIILLLRATAIGTAMLLGVLFVGYNSRKIKSFKERIREKLKLERN